MGEEVHARVVEVERVEQALSTVGEEGEAKVAPLFPFWKLVHRRRLGVGGSRGADTVELVRSDRQPFRREVDELDRIDGSRLDLALRERLVLAVRARAGEPAL